MAELANFFIALGSKFDESGINKGIKKIENFKKKTENIAKGFKIAGAALTAFATAGAISIINLTGKASDLEETTSKFNTVFKGQEKVAKEWAKTLVKSYGVSTEQSKRFLGSIQDLLVPMGMNAIEAGKLSNEVVKLSVDLGSFNNLPTEKVMLDIQSALVGNFETMKKYGVVLNETRVKQEIMNQGWVTSEKDITQSMKAQASYNLIVDGSTAAIGDAIRTSGSYANQVRIMKNRIADLSAKLGDKLIPVMKKIVGWIVKFTKKLQELEPETVATIAKILLLTTAIAGILGPLALFIGFLPQIVIGLTQVTAALKLATVATKKLWLTISAHPIGAAITALGLLTIGMINYWKKSVEAGNATIKLGDSTKTLIDIQKREMDHLKQVATSTTVTEERRKWALERYKLLLKSVAVLEKKLEEEKADAVKKAEKAKTKITKQEIDKRKALAQKEADLLMSTAQESAAFTKELNQEFRDSEREKQDEADLITMERRQLLFDTGVELIQGYFNLKLQRLQNDTDQTLENENAQYDAKRDFIINNVADEAERNAQLELLEKEHESSSDRIKKEGAEKEKKIKRRQKRFSIAEAIINTSVGATKALAQGGPFVGPFLAAMITALGAVQIAMIKAQKFAKGAMAMTATPAIFGEAGPEIALPLNHPNTTKLLSDAMAMAGGRAGGTNIYITVPPITSRRVADEYGNRIGDSIMRKIRRNRKL